MPKPDHIPPMAWIRAFFSAASMGSFKLAAKTLNVSPSTISHEVRKLESWLEAPLFSRTGRGLLLTDEGEKLLLSIRPVFKQLDAAFANFADNNKKELKLGVLPFFASEFLLPRMASLKAVTHNYAIRLVSNNHLASLSETNTEQRLDAVVRYSVSPPSGYESIELTGIALALVVGKQIDPARQTSPLKYIQVDGGFNGWARVKAENLQCPEEKGRRLIVDNYISALKAVTHGLGIAIMVLPLSYSWLESGKLHFWSKEKLHIPERYWLVFSKLSSKSAVLEKLGLCLHEEFSRKAGMWLI